MKKIFFSFAVILIGVFAVYAQDIKLNGKSTNQDIVKKDKPLNILEIPKPSYPDREGGTICVTGSVRLRVQFLASGKVGKISPITNLGYGMTEKAVEAAEKIQFEPAVKDGKAVTVTKIIVISFTIY